MFPTHTLCGSFNNKVIAKIKQEKGSNNIAPFLQYYWNIIIIVEMSLR
jgi:hypothetical protein